MCWQGHGSLRFGGASTKVFDAYGNPVNKDFKVVAGSSHSGLREDDDSWNLTTFRFLGMKKYLGGPDSTLRLFRNNVEALVLLFPMMAAVHSGWHYKALMHCSSMDRRGCW